MKHIVATGAAVLLMAGATSCNHKPLCYEHPHTTPVRVEFNWREAPDAKPEGMCVYFYSVDEPAKSLRFDFPQSAARTIDLPEGRYRLICYNNDTEQVLFANTGDYTGHRAYTRFANILEPIYGNGMATPPRDASTEDEDVVLAPDRLVGCTATDLVVTQDALGYVHGPTDPWADDDGVYVDSKDKIIELFPHDMLCYYTYEIKNVKNLKYAMTMSCAITGMAGAMDLPTEQLPTDPVTLPLAAESDAQSHITGEFYTFGHHPESDVRHRMAVYVVMKDGSKFSYTTGNSLDVTDQVHAAPDRHRVHIVIDGLELPKPIENGGGFNPSVDDWGSVEQDIIM